MSNEYNQQEPHYPYKSPAEWVTALLKGTAPRDEDGKPTLRQPDGRPLWPDVPDSYENVFGPVRMTTVDSYTEEDAVMDLVDPYG